MVSISIILLPPKSYEIMQTIFEEVITQKFMKDIRRLMTTVSVIYWILKKKRLSCAITGITNLEEKYSQKRNYTAKGKGEP